MNISTEDYLRAIYTLHEKHDTIKSVEVAKLLDVSKPSVSSKIKKLVTLGYIEADLYSKINLTKKGLKEAKRLTHNHRVIEVFLHDILHYGTKQGHEEAHRLEHAFSDESIKRLDLYLNNPDKSPAGKIIPHSSSNKTIQTTLDKIKKGQHAKIIKISGTGNIKRRMLDMGIVKGTIIKVERIAPLGDPIVIKVKGYSLSLRKSEAKTVQVEQ